MDDSANVALITGAARRVGRTVALELARAGFDVAIHFLASQKDAERTAEDVRSIGRRATLIRGDLNDPASWSAIVEQAAADLGRLDVLVNNASLFDASVGLCGASTAREFDSDHWERMFRINTTAPAGLAHHARSHLEAGGRGRIVNICDISADRPWPSQLSYCCSKAALVALTKGLARALAPTITVNGVAPGIAVFPDEYPPELRERLVRRVPLAREGTPGDIAHVVRFLVETGDYITGQIIAVDGGRNLV